ncbi:hypothetical protein HCEG_05294 [Histoplasma capsulatum var. duboisii H88]|uniref:Uncharacterized protein n=1 Tax=Ajellomyces capsulatus (strain H88) TaxID=544711 RepID=F0UKX5_AJEC8|nr:hypothetical protein HCEG_05294 [Histoplasma capsulatum var. duboisii H88]
MNCASVPFEPHEAKMIQHSFLPALAPYDVRAANPQVAIVKKPAAHLPPLFLSRTTSMSYMAVVSMKRRE